MGQSEGQEGRELAALETELDELRRRSRPLTVVLFVVALVTMLSAAAGTSLGLPSGLHLYTAPVLILVVLLRLPGNLRMMKLSKEIAARRARGS